MRKVKLGIIGCGVIGPHHMKAAKASPLIDLVAVADRIGERAAAKAAEFGVPKTFREGADLIRDPDVEAVVLAFPAGERAALAMQAFRTGKHVLLEKPPALSAAEIEGMIAVQGDRVGACCSSRYKFPDSYRAARDAFASGVLGEVRELYCRAMGAAGPAPVQPPPSWRENRRENGGGILVNWSPYDLDYLLGVAGYTIRPRKVFASTWPVAPHLAARVAPGTDAEGHYAALVRCEGGAVLHVERGEFTSIRTENAWQVIGSRASLRLHMTDDQDKKIFLDEADGAGGVSTRTVWEGPETQGALVHAGPVTDFARAILEKVPPQTGLRQALLIQRLFDAIYASAQSGEAVDIVPVDRLP